MPCGNPPLDVSHILIVAPGGFFAKRPRLQDVRWFAEHCQFEPLSISREKNSFVLDVKGRLCAEGATFFRISMEARNCVVIFVNSNESMADAVELHNIMRAMTSGNPILKDQARKAVRQKLIEAAMRVDDPAAALERINRIYPPGDPS